jgi:hypothetical protein
VIRSAKPFARDELFAAIVEAPALYAHALSGWDGHELDLSAAKRCAANAFHHDRTHPLRPEQLVAPAARWAEIVYGEPHPPSLAGSFRVTSPRRVEAHGLGVWFRATLASGIGFDTAPGHDHAYGRAFLPFERPLGLAPGDEANVELRVTRGGADHLWGWTVTVVRDGSAIDERRHSTFFGDPTPPSVLAKDAASYVPTAGVAGRARAAILAAMDGRRSTREIAEAVHAAHPGAFASFEECLVETRRQVSRFA